MWFYPTIGAWILYACIAASSMNLVAGLRLWVLNIAIFLIFIRVCHADNRTSFTAWAVIYGLVYTLAAMGLEWPNVGAFLLQPEVVIATLAVPILEYVAVRIASRFFGYSLETTA